MKQCSLVALLAIVLAGVLIPTLASAQAPPYLYQWSVQGQYPQPSGVAVGASGNVYVAAPGDDRIYAFTSSGTYLTQWGTLGSGDGQFNRPRGVAVDGSGNVYVADMNNQRIQVFGYLPVPTKPPTWGRIKALYR
jgi:glucose/arabinose dehydrogenase